MTQETFEQMATRAYETAMGQELRPRDKSSVLKVLAAFRDELANGQEPIGWLYTDAYGTHYTGDKREWYVAVGIEEVTPVYARPFVAAPSGVPDFEPDAKRLALELECLLLECKDIAAVSKWWDSAHEALEQHRAMLSAAAPTDAVDKDAGWLPIETAPKDKEIFLTDGDNVSLGQWVGRYFAWGYSADPTHWMPLPAASNAAMQGKESGK